MFAESKRRVNAAGVTYLVAHPRFLSVNGRGKFGFRISDFEFFPTQVSFEF
jgi:hypothetical protein